MAVAVVAAAAAGEGAVVPAPAAVAADSRRQPHLGQVPQPPDLVLQRLGPALQPPALGPRRVLVLLGVRLALGRQPVMSRGAPVPRQVR